MNGICERYKFLSQLNTAMTTFRDAIHNTEYVITPEPNLARENDIATIAEHAKKLAAGC